jgi:hypothetical protein
MMQWPLGCSVLADLPLWHFLPSAVLGLPLATESSPKIRFLPVWDQNFRKGQKKYKSAEVQKKPWAGIHGRI